MLWRDLITQATSELTLGVHKNLLKWVHAFQIELEFGYVGFWGEGKTGLPGEKPLGAKERTNNKLNPNMVSTPGFKPGPNWWEVSALTTAPPLLLTNYRGLIDTGKGGHVPSLNFKSSCFMYWREGHVTVSLLLLSLQFYSLLWQF